MNSTLQQLHTEIVSHLQEYEEKTLGFLKGPWSLSDEQISFFLSGIDNSRAFLNLYKDEIIGKHKQSPDVYAALVGLSKIRNLLQLADATPDIPINPDRVLRLAFSAFHSGIDLGTVVGKSVGLSFDRKSTPAKKHRNQSPFTSIMEYLFLLCRNSGENKLIAPGNPDGFMDYVKKLIRPGKNQNQYVAEFIDRVVCGAGGYFYMQEGKGKTTRLKVGDDQNKYIRSCIQTKLSDLRKKYS